MDTDNARFAERISTNAAGENNALINHHQTQQLQKKLIMNEPNSIKHVCFDLDGTLIDSFNTIYKSTVQAMRELKINSPVPEKEFYSRIGLHFIDIFRDLEIPVIDFEEFITIYKKHYFEFIDDSKPFTGTEESLAFLNSEGIHISLLTTKGQDQADKIIDHFGFRKYFSFVMGRRDNIANKPSAEPLIFICNNLKVSPKATLMVGDTELDIQCGKNAGSKTCAAAYGYRPASILKNENPDFIINKIHELKNLLNNKK